MKTRFLLVFSALIVALVIFQARADIKVTGGTKPAQTSPSDAPHSTDTDPAAEPHSVQTPGADEPKPTPDDSMDEPHPDVPDDTAIDAGGPGAEGKPAASEAGSTPASAPKKKPGAGGATIMSAEQGDELGRKLEEYEKAQAQLLEKLDKLGEDIEFTKSSLRRPPAPPH